MGESTRRVKHLLANHERTEPKVRVPRSETAKPYEGRHRQPSGHDDPIKFVSQLINVISNFPRMYEEAEKEVDKLESEYADLAHVVEFADIKKSSEASRLLKRLKDVRSKRRDAKDFLYTSKALYEFVKSRQGMLTDLTRIESDMHKIKDSHERRKYTPRVLGSIEEAYASAGLKPPSEAGSKPTE